MLTSNSSRILVSCALLLSLSVQGVCWCAHAAESLAIESTAQSAEQSCCVVELVPDSTDAEDGTCAITAKPMPLDNSCCCTHCSLSSTTDSSAIATQTVIRETSESFPSVLPASDLSTIVVANLTRPSTLPTARVEATSLHIQHCSFRC